MKLIKLSKKKPSFLLIAIPGIGDALLATPLVNSIHQHYPNSTIDIIVRGGSEGILKNNPQINEVIAFPKRPRLKDHLRLIPKIFRRYDVAISTSSSDRSFLNCLTASSKILTLAPKKNLQSIWKYLLAHRAIPLDDTTHVINQNLQLLESLDIPRLSKVIISESLNAKSELSSILPNIDSIGRFIVIHTMPGSDYKVWPTTQWKEVVLFLIENNFHIVLTGGNGSNEHSICQEICDLNSNYIHNACGKLSFDAVAELIKQADAYIGTDTSTTHLAAATGTLTFGIYGPSNILKWSPWPLDYHETRPPFLEEAGVQRNGNVVVLRADCKCKNFSKTCSQTASPISLCLQEMKASQLIDAIKKHLILREVTAKQV